MMVYSLNYETGEIEEFDDGTHGMEEDIVEITKGPTLEDRLQVAEDTIMFLLMGGM